MVDQVTYWFRLRMTRRWHLRGIGAEVVYGLDPHNEDGSVNDAAWEEALHRYKTLRAERRVERKHKRAERDKPEPPEPNRCSFCGEPAAEDRLVVTDGRYQIICELCIKKATAVFAKLRGKK